MSGSSRIISVENAIAQIRDGKTVIVVDDENRENEGDLVVAADFATPEAVNFFAREGRGLICCALAPEIVDQLELPLMVAPDKNESGFGTPFTISVEAREGVTTGISAHDRAHTIKTLIADGAGPTDIVSPGHTFPLRARPGGVLERNGQTEAGVDLAKLAGLTPAAMICEVMNDDGTMARLGDLEVFAAKHDLGIISVKALQEYRRQTELNLDAVTAAE